MYKDKSGVCFVSNAHLGKAVIEGLALSTFDKAKYDLWRRDHKLTLWDMGAQRSGGGHHDFQRSYAKLLAL